MAATMAFLPHVPGHTLLAEAFMDESELVGFSVAHQLNNVALHFHDFYELGLVIEGTGWHVTSDGEQRVQHGSVIFVAPGVSHGYRMGENLVVYNCMLRMEAAQFDLPWARRDQWLGHLFGAPGITSRVPSVLALDERSLLECLAHLDAIRERPSDERSEAYDLGHLLLALDVVGRQLQRDQPAPLSIDPGASSLVTAAIGLLDHDLQRRWKLDELASQLYVGSYHLIRQFDRWVGLPPIAYLNRRRCERAASLLATTDSPIRAIGAQVGWPEPSQFARRFRQHMDMSPREYRARSRRHYAARHRSQGDATRSKSPIDAPVGPAAPVLS